MKKLGAISIIVILVAFGIYQATKPSEEVTVLGGPVAIVKPGSPVPPPVLERKTAPPPLAKAPPQPTTPKRETSDPRIKQVWELLEEGRRDAALSLLNELLKTNPNDEAVLVELGMALLIDPTKLAQAEGLLRKAISINPENEQAVSGLVEAYYRAGKREQLVKALGDLVAGKPKSPNLLAAYGRALAAEGRTAEAIEYLRKASLGSGDGGASFSLAELYRQRGDFDNAIVAYEQVVAAQQREYDKMKEQGVDTRSIERDIALNQLNVASALISKGRTQEAERLLESISRTLPGDPNVEAVARRLKGGG